jgi:hypothetical protein
VPRQAAQGRQHGRGAAALGGPGPAGGAGLPGQALLPGAGHPVGLAVGDELADQVGMHRDHLAPGSFPAAAARSGARIVRAVGSAYTAALGNWASASRPVRPPDGVNTERKSQAMRKEGAEDGDSRHARTGAGQGRRGVPGADRAAPAGAAGALLPDARILRRRRFVTDLGATIAAGNVVIGHRLGLYKALAAGPARADSPSAPRPAPGTSTSGCAARRPAATSPTTRKPRPTR